MNKMPLVSIIINNYNYGRFLAAAIDSALTQSYAQTEVIVVDDGSTDDSHAILASYGARITPVLTANGGQASAFNAGFARGRGDIVIGQDRNLVAVRMRRWHDRASWRGVVLGYGPIMSHPALRGSRTRAGRGIGGSVADR